MLKTTGASALGGSIMGLINQWSVQLFSVPLTVVGMTAAGTLLSYGYGPKVENRKRLYMEALFITFFATTIVAVVPAFMGWDWVKPQLQAPLGGFLGIALRFALPHVEKMLPELLRKVLRLEKKDANS